MQIVWIGVGGFLGAVSRYGVDGWVGRFRGDSFPWGTFAVNISGSLALGFVITLMTERYVPTPELRTAVTVGFLGAYTTFSTFALESFRFGEDGAFSLAAFNLIGSVFVGVLAVWLGIQLARLV